MHTLSPLIENGRLSLSSDNNLVMGPDIKTQMPVTLTAYHCIYDYTIDSKLIPYLNSIPNNGFNINTITNIVTTAYQSVISKGIITDLQIAVIPITTNYVTINITAQDANGEPVVLKWNNA